MPRLRVGLFTNNYLPTLGGVPTAVETLRRGLVLLGHEAVVVAPRMRGPSDDVPHVVRVPAVPAPTHPDFALPWPLRASLRRHLASLDLDVIHAHHPFLLGGSARRLARATGRPLVFTYHTLYDRYAHYAPLLPAPVMGRLALGWAGRYAEAADLVVVPSVFLADRLRRQGVRRPIAVIPTGVDLTRFGPGDRRQARRALGLPDGGPVLLYAGRLDREKNLGLLLAAFAETRAPGARLLLVGRGTCEAALRNAVRTGPVAERVVFLGGLPADQMARAYQAADVFVFASTTETQGLAVLEAMACGLPVVAVRATGIEEAVVDGVTGLLVPEDRQAFAEAVGRVLTDPDLGRKLAAGGAEAARGLSAPAMVAGLVDRYQEILARRGRAGHLE